MNFFLVKGVVFWKKVLSSQVETLLPLKSKIDPDHG